MAALYAIRSAASARVLFEAVSASRYSTGVSPWLKRFGLPLLYVVCGMVLGQQYDRYLERMEMDLRRTDLRIDTASGAVAVVPRREVDLTQFWRVWDHLIDEYIDPNQLQTEKLLNGAMRGLVSAVGDPYTQYLLPKEAEEFRESMAGQFEGIGAELAERDGAIIVERPIKNSPALRAGLQRDDVIVAVNGEETAGKSVNEVVSKIRGPKGTTVVLQLYRPSLRDTLEVSIVRKQIHVPSVEQKFVPGMSGTIGYLALNQFGDSSLAEIKQELERFEQEGVKGVILDLRGNGGGYLDGAIDLVSLFLQEGEVVSVHRREGKTDSYTVNGQPLFPDIPLVVLQDAGSASASEITSGALQDHGRATVIGTKSFGKGTVQEVYDFPGGGGLRLTIAKWHTPSGRDLSKEGVQPDYEVQRTAEDLKANRDPQLDAALDFLNGKDISKYILKK